MTGDGPTGESVVWSPSGQHSLTTWSWREEACMYPKEWAAATSCVARLGSGFIST